MKEGVLYSRESNTGIVGKHSISTSPLWEARIRADEKHCINYESTKHTVAGTKLCWTAEQDSGGTG